MNNAFFSRYEVLWTMIRKKLYYILYYIIKIISWEIFLIISSTKSDFPDFNNILFRISLTAINNFYEFEIKFNNTLDWMKSLYWFIIFYDLEIKFESTLRHCHVCHFINGTKIIAILTGRFYSSYCIISHPVYRYPSQEDTKLYTKMLHSIIFDDNFFFF